MSDLYDGATIWARQTISSDIFCQKPHSWFKIWFYIVNRAYHTDFKQLKRGQCFLKYEWVEESCAVSRNEVDHCIRWLKSASMLATQKATRGFIVTVFNYNLFQDLNSYKSDTKSDDSGDTKATEKRHKSDTIQKNDKNEKNDENINTGAAAPKIEKGTSSIASVLKDRFKLPVQESKQVSTSWQDKALRYAKGLKIDLDALDKGIKSRYFKVFKSADAGRNRKNLEIAYSYLADFTRPLTPIAKVKYLFWIYENGPITNKSAGFAAIGKVLLVAAVSSLVLLFFPRMMFRTTIVKPHEVTKPAAVSPTRTLEVSRRGRSEATFATASAVLSDVKGTAYSIAGEFGINPETFICVLQHESGLNSRNPDGSLKCGDSGRSCGIGQIQLPTWISIRRHAGWSTEDRRGDDIENMRTTAYGLSTLWYEHWTGYRICHYQLGMNL